MGHLGQLLFLVEYEGGEVEEDGNGSMMENSDEEETEDKTNPWVTARMIPNLF